MLFLALPVSTLTKRALIKPSFGAITLALTMLIATIAPIVSTAKAPLIAILRIRWPLKTLFSISTPLCNYMHFYFILYLL